MFIDYITLLLINMTAGLVLLAAYLLAGLGRNRPGRWAAGFAAVGLVAFLAGLHMTLTWPVPGPFNMAFGEMSVLFGALYLAAAMALLTRSDLIGVGVCAAVAGAAAVALGVRMIDLGLTRRPVMSGVGFILSGAGGALTFVAVALRRVRSLRWLAAAVLVAAAAIWAATGYPAYWGHMESFKAYTPPAAQSGP